MFPFWEDIQECFVHLYKISDKREIVIMDVGRSKYSFFGLSCVHFLEYKWNYHFSNFRATHVAIHVLDV
jgi:hypothetical protein